MEYSVFSEIYTNTYAGGGTVEGGVSGVELNAGGGTTTGLVAGGAAMGTLRKGSSAIGTLREYQDTGMNMAFLDSYFSEVTLLHSYTQRRLVTSNTSSSNGRPLLKYMQVFLLS